MLYNNKNTEYFYLLNTQVTERYDLTVAIGGNTLLITVRH